MNPEHVAIVRQGKEAIAAWRLAHRDERLNLNEANLATAHLDGADLAGADLYGANLAGDNLAGAELDGAVLARAFLNRAHLAGANLTGAHLAGADLTGADLTGADLTGANLATTVLHRTVLKQAQFAGARFFGTVMAACDLSVALGLESAVHGSPSTIGLDTIVGSGGNIPDMFLRGCGYDPIIQRIIHGDSAEKTDAFYEWLGQGGGPLRFQSCFISYTSENKAFVDRLQKALNNKGIDYWYAPEHGRWGEELTTQFDREMRIRDRLILVCSEASLYNSDWVRWEIDRAIEVEKERNTRVIFPVMLDDALLKWNHPRASRIREVLAGDFRRATRGRAFETALTRLIKGLRAS
jgi:hypothetical protein